MWSPPRGGRPHCVTGWTPGCDAGDCCVALLRGSAETWLSRLAESRGVTGPDVVVSRRPWCVTCRCVAPDSWGCLEVVAPTLWTACPLELRRGLPPSQLAVGHPTSADCRCRLDVTDCDLWRLPVGSIAGVSVPVWRPTSQDSHTGCAVGCPPLQAMGFHRVCGQLLSRLGPSLECRYWSTGDHLWLSRLVSGSDEGTGWSPSAGQTVSVRRRRSCRVLRVDQLFQIPERWSSVSVVSVAVACGDCRLVSRLYW